MALTGKIVKLDRDQYGFENTMTYDSEPKQTRMVWPLINCRTSGMSWVDVNDVFARQAELRDGTVSVYMGNGNYFSGYMPQGGSTKAIISEVSDVPCPKVRKGTEVRWSRGQWQKYLKSQGWVAA